MMVLSLISGMPLGNSWEAIYKYEFNGVIFSIKAGTLTKIQITAWILLLIFHAGVLCLILFTRYKYFKELFMIIPAIFIFMYMIVGGGIAIFLIPFGIVWIITLINLKKLINS